MRAMVPSTLYVRRRTLKTSGPKQTWGLEISAKRCVGTCMVLRASENFGARKDYSILGSPVDGSYHLEPLRMAPACPRESCWFSQINRDMQGL